MSLLAPWFLAGFFLLSIPVIIHLTHSRRTETTPFPSLRFLHRLPAKTRHRRRIRDPLLFALRCLALILLALAFSRPLVETTAAADVGTERDIVLAVDVSASMSYGNRWQVVQDSVARILGSLGVGDRAGVLSFAVDAVEHAPLSEVLSSAREAVTRLEPTEGGTRLDGALRLAGRMLADSERAVREVVLISDFQRTAWDDAGQLQLPDGVSLRGVSVGDAVATNLAITEGTMRTRRDGRGRVQARVMNLSDQEVPGVPLTLEIAGRQVGSRPVDLPPREAVTVIFDDIALPDRRARARLYLPSDDLRVDDTFHFVAMPDPGIGVVLVDEPRGGDDPSVFLAQALAVSDRPRMTVTHIRASQLDIERLAGAGVVFINDANVLSLESAGPLLNWVRDGGGLFLALGPRARPEQWPAEIGQLLGGEPGPVVDAAAGRRLSWLEYDHPVFELFAAAQSGDFTAARFLRYREVRPGDGAHAVARFDGGVPAMYEHTVGEGRVLVWTSTLDRYWNDLALQPVFLPFIHRAALYLADYRQPPSSARTGDVLDLVDIASALGVHDPGGPESEREWVLVDPAGDRNPIVPDVGAEEMSRWVEVTQRGFYQVEMPENPLTAMLIAVNTPADESDLTPFAQETMVEAVTGLIAGPEAPVGGGESTAGGADSVQQVGVLELWPYLLGLAVAVLLVEGLMANRRSSGSIGGVRRRTA